MTNTLRLRGHLVSLLSLLLFLVMGVAFAQNEGEEKNIIADEEASSEQVIWANTGPERFHESAPVSDVWQPMHLEGPEARPHAMPFSEPIADNGSDQIHRVSTDQGNFEMHGTDEESPMGRYLRERREKSLTDPPESRHAHPRAKLFDMHEPLDPKARTGEDYRLRVGDTLRLSIYGELNSEREVTVDNHGNISYILVGSVQAVGKTIDELRALLNEKVKHHLQFGVVNVTPVSFGGLYFTILGQVNEPGKKQILGKTSLLQAISRAGGFRVGFFRAGTVELADLSHAFVARKGEYVPVDFEALVFGGDMSHNIEIESGDYILIPSSLERDIFVLGEVSLPANIGYLNHETLVSALAKARGVTEFAGNFAYIIRGSLSNPTRIEVNIKALFHGAIPDIVLKPGDIVYVPERRSLFFEELIQAGLTSFVVASSNVAGRKAFEEIEPDAADRGSTTFFP